MKSATRYIGLVVVLLLGLVSVSSLYAQEPATSRATLERTALDTWQSFVAMTYSDTGLTADNLTWNDGGEEQLSGYTSPTNIGSYMWSAIVARDLNVISSAEATERISQTLATVAGLERSEMGGMFYNWYDPETGEKLTTWPVDGGTVYPFLSSVDNGWLATALMVVRAAVPELADEANAILDDMNFACYYDPAAGLIRGGFWDTDPPPGGWPVDNYCGEGEDVYYTGHHYGTLNTEPRIASYISLAGVGGSDTISPTHYYKMWRTLPATCDWNWHEMRPEGEVVSYTVGTEVVPVFEGTYEYRGIDIVPSWGGSMFEALMVPLFVPEEDWGPTSWGVNHPLFVQGQIEHGLHEAQYGYWGFSPSNNPDGGYREYGVDPMGMDPGGYTSNQERTTVDYGFEGCDRPVQPEPSASAYTNGVVTPHATFLALEYAPEAALENLDNLRRDFDIYGPYGYYDAVNVDTGDLAEAYLALDQGMIMAALGNYLGQGLLRNYFAPQVEEAVRPLMTQERFGNADDPPVRVTLANAGTAPALSKVPLALAIATLGAGIVALAFRRRRR